MPKTTSSRVGLNTNCNSEAILHINLKQCQWRITFSLLQCFNCTQWLRNMYWCQDFQLHKLPFVGWSWASYFNSLILFLHLKNWADNSYSHRFDIKIKWDMCSTLSTCLSSSNHHILAKGIYVIVGIVYVEFWGYPGCLEQ